MVYQTQSNAYVAYKKQSGLGVQQSGAGASILRAAGGQGGRLTKGVTASNEARRDAMRTRGRHGIQKTAGSYSGEWSLGSLDDILASMMRGGYGVSDLVLDEGDFTSITTGENTIVLASGDPRDLGLRVFDVFRLNDHASGGNNARNLRITGLDATTITVAETLTVNAVADTACTITRPGRVLINPPAGSLVRDYYTIEECELDIDGSEVFTDCFWGGATFRMGPNGILMFEPQWVGTGKFDVKTGATSPFFTSPAETTTEPMAVVDATIRVGSEDVVDLTAFDITMTTAPTAPETFGSGQIKTSPDVFPGSMAVNVNFTALRSDLSRVASLRDEEVLSLHVLAVDNEPNPQSFLSIAIGNFTLGGVDKSAISKEGGPKTQTISVPAELVGKDERGAGYDPTMVKFQISNAA